MKSIKNVRSLKGKQVMVRVDFNAPVKKGKVLDDFRLQAALPTITYLLKKKAKVILLTHLGRPKGKVVAALRTKPLAKQLSVLLDQPVKSTSKVTGKVVEKAIASLKDGECLMLENVQFDPGERENDEGFSQTLAGYADYFVMDCFGQSHRNYASISGVSQFAKSYAGLLLEKEVFTLSTLMKKPKRPFVVVLGGGKLETKIPVMKNLLTKADRLLVGGALVNTYFKAAGYGVGKSLVSDALAKEALQYIKKKQVVIPVDVVVGDWKGKKTRLVSVGKKPHQLCKPGEAILDIGPETITLFANHIKEAKTLMWNGAMGYFEQEPYHVGTMSIARLVSSRSKGKAFGVIGGGETLQAMDMAGGMEDIDFVSTGGGAMLTFLAGEELPGVEALST